MVILTVMIILTVMVILMVIVMVVVIVIVFIIMCRSAVQRETSASCRLVVLLGSVRTRTSQGLSSTQHTEQKA